MIEKFATKDSVISLDNNFNEMKDILDKAVADIKELRELFENIKSSGSGSSQPVNSVSTNDIIILRNRVKKTLNNNNL